MSCVPLDKPSFLLSQFDEIIHALEVEDSWYCMQQTDTHEIYVGWESPREDWTVLNTDGASKGNPGPTGGGGIIRGCRGEWLGGFAERMGVCTSMKAKIKAVYRGLQLAKSMNIRNLWVKLDSQIVVGMLNGGFPWSKEHEPLLNSCKKLIQSQDWVVKISHCYREANQVADKLANLGINLPSGCTVFSSPPQEIMELLYADNVVAV